MMEAFLVSSTCSYVKNVYYEKYNSNAKIMFVLKFKKLFERMSKHRFFCERWCDTNSNVSAKLQGVGLPYSRLQYAFELTLLQLGLLRVVTWLGSWFLKKKDL